MMGCIQLGLVMLQALQKIRNHGVFFKLLA